jgi:hypothetical protein
VKKLTKMTFFTIKIYYISSSNDPNITQTKIIFGVDHTFNVLLERREDNTISCILNTRRKYARTFERAMFTAGYSYGNNSTI